MKRKEAFATGEYYHVYGRGNDRRNIFRDQRDWTRFLFLVLYFQSGTPFYNLGRHISHFIKHRAFGVPDERRRELLNTRVTELAAFCLMPNHFHLIAHESREGGISSYMQRILTGYTTYFNTRYRRSGHLFQGPFRSVRVKDNNQLLYLSTYIHKNPRGLARWKDKEHEYPYSSLQDYVRDNRWGKLLERDIILSQFSAPEEFRTFTDTSIAKNPLPEALLIDLD